MKYQSGDRVRYVGAECSSRINQEAIIERTDKSTVPYYLRFCDGGTCWCRGTDIVPINEENKTEKVGEKSMNYSGMLYI